tara:strand:- start:10979 stop:11368 length:390 start_codon:yes stop_codon:yes gene_type:complete
MPVDIQFPHDLGSKVVQFIIDGKHVLRSGPVLGSFIPIVERTLGEYGKHYTRARLMEDADHIPAYGPPLTGDGYEIVGMGVITVSGNRAILGGRSETYNLGPNEDHIRRCLELAGETLDLMVTKYVKGE